MAGEASTDHMLESSRTALIGDGPDRSSDAVALPLAELQPGRRTDAADNGAGTMGAAEPLRNGTTADRLLITDSGNVVHLSAIDEDAEARDFSATRAARPSAVPPHIGARENSFAQGLQYKFTPEKGHIVAVDTELGRKLSGSMPAYLTWQRLGYSVNVKTREGGKRRVEEKVILSEFTGVCKPGEIVAIMGTSGAGKTTLLNVLSGRHVTGNVIGTILLNGRKRSKMFKRQSAYVEQDDLLYANLTVGETFYYAANLRLPGRLTREEKLKRADEVIMQLGLTHVRETRIGSNEYRGISGGERKRTAIGVEIITNPKLLFLDEPTSGLDSFTARHVMESVRDLARGGRAVMCTIHQPRSNIYELFDVLLLLSKGHTVYSGPAQYAPTWFALQGYPCPQQANPADHFIDITTVDSRSSELESKSLARAEKLIQAYATSTLAQDSAKECEELVAQLHANQSDAEAGTASVHFSWNLPWLVEFALLYGRAWKNFIRDKRATVAGLFQSIILALVAGGVFFGLGNDQNSIQNRTGALFFVSINNCFTALTMASSLFHSEKQVFQRERAAGNYRVSAYYLSKSLSELPVQIFFPIIYTCIVYYMIGFNPSASCFFTFMLVLIVMVLTAQSLGVLISAVSPTFAVAQAIMPFVMILFMLFGGFYLNSANVWPGFYWIKYISFIYYGFQALTVNEYTGLTFTCTESNRCLSTGEQVLQSLSFQGASIWEDVGILIALMVAFRIVGYIFLRLFSKAKLKLD